MRDGIDSNGSDIPGIGFMRFSVVQPKNDTCTNLKIGLFVIVKDLLPKARLILRLEPMSKVEVLVQPV